MKRVAVTGGVSCGKTSVCRFLKACGAYTVSADEVVHELLNPTTNLGKAIVRLLGPDVVVGGQFDRSKIASKVFDDIHLLRSLEALLHPAVWREIDARYRQVSTQGGVPLFVAEIPLLFETIGDMSKDYDITIAVIAPPERCLERFIAATGGSKEDFQKRMARQMSAEEKAARADYVLVNDGDQAQLQQAVEKLFRSINQ